MGSFLIPSVNPDPNCFKRSGYVKAGARIDDYGSIGGVTIQNNVPCASVSVLGADADITMTEDPFYITVAYGAMSEEECGAPTRVKATIVIEFERI